MVMNERIELLLAGVGAVCGYFFGGLDMLLQVFVIVLILDTVTGMTKGFSTGTYESKKFRQGLWKKCGYMLAVILAVQLDRLVGDTGALRTALLFCFIANEGTSIIENLGEMGVPIPEPLINAIAVLKNKGDGKNDNNKTEE